MATMSDTYDEAVADIIRRGYADFQGSDTGNRWLQLHTADPTDAGGSRVTGVPRVAIALNEIQALELTGTPDGGTFTLTYDTQTTGNIAFNASAADVQAALEALSSVGAGNVLCTAAGALPGNIVSIEFVKALGQQSLALATADGANLTGGTTPDAAITETVDGFDLLGAYVDDGSSGGRLTDNAATIELTASATADETATHASLWINESGTTAAEMVISEALAASVAYTTGQPVEVAAGALDLFGAGYP
jgi:hypothetical protein